MVTTEIYTLSLHDALPISRPRNCTTALTRLPSFRNRMAWRSEEHTSELQSRRDLVCRLLLEKKKNRFVAPPTQDRKKVELANSGEDDLCARCVPHLSPSATRKPRCGLSAPTVFFFFNDTATTEIYTLSLHVALPI